MPVCRIDGSDLVCTAGPISVWIPRWSFQDGHPPQPPVDCRRGRRDDDGGGLPGRVLRRSAGLHTNPYLGIVFFLVLPALFIFGLLLIPIGAWRERQRRLAGRPPSQFRWPRVDLDTTRSAKRDGDCRPVELRQRHHHGARQLPRYSVHGLGPVLRSGLPHGDATGVRRLSGQPALPRRSRASECHIGAGASWFARSKVSGTRQVFAVMLRTYSRPIPSPVQNLRPARDTCEQCHWPDKFMGDKIVRMHEFANDDKNTGSVTTLQVHVGGGSERLGPAQGIHWHVSLANVIEYIATDDKRQVIPYVRLTDRLGSVRAVYVVEGTTPAQLGKGERRRMDCMDCHNRPSHSIAPTAEKAVDALMAQGAIPTTLPLVRREAVQVRQGELPDTTGRRRGDRTGAEHLLPHAVREPLRGAARRRRPGDTDHRGDLPPERVPRDERRVRDLPEQHRARRLSRLLPVPRRQSQKQGRTRHQSGLRAVPLDQLVHGPIDTATARAPSMQCRRLTNLVTGTRLEADNEGRARRPRQ